MLFWILWVVRCSQYQQIWFLTFPGLLKIDQICGGIQMMALKVSTDCFFFSLTSIVFFSQVPHSPHVVPVSDRRQIWAENGEPGMFLPHLSTLEPWNIFCNRENQVQADWVHTAAADEKPDVKLESLAPEEEQNLDSMAQDAPGFVVPFDDTIQKCQKISLLSLF